MLIIGIANKKGCGKITVVNLVTNELPESEKIKQSILKYV
ncbi:hypothetical protein ATE84_2183 [Aquimarina sp. MAR_2010_214]|nr:hypothetical protein ATE84_2183 [Aquimarina sp. MAR_2010_214]